MEEVVDPHTRLGAHQAQVDARLERWRREDLCRRIWEKDHTVWSPRPRPELTDRLGWLHLPEHMRGRLDELARTASEVRRDGTADVVLLGMGGSSLAPEVFGTTFGTAVDCPRLTVLDSTHPDAVRAVADRIDPEATVFVVSSKSGTTLETLSLFRTFWGIVSDACPEPGRRFVAVTDPGTPLEALARDRRFRETFRAPPDVGGRYSALSVFGLVPAALVGIDVHRLTEHAANMASACAPGIAAESNPALALGAALGELALAGVDKLTFETSGSLRAFPAWIEQLVAESTGKDGRGIIPVDGEPARPVGEYGHDRVFVIMISADEEASALSARADELARAEHPVIRVRLGDKADLGSEMFRWELATAAAGAVLGIHPFDQPDVQLAKDLAHRAMAGNVDPDTSRRNAEVDCADTDALRAAVDGWAHAVPGDYVSIHAYLAPHSDTTDALQRIRARLGGRLGVATTLGYGPRFLHSTGQLHKGGPNTGIFLQLVDEPANDLAVPETDYTFARLIAAQAMGDFQALRQRERRVLRVNLGRDVPAALDRLLRVLA